MRVFPSQRVRDQQRAPSLGTAVLPGGRARWPELSGAPRRRSEPAWVPIAPASPGRSRAVYRPARGGSDPRPVSPRASPGAPFNTSNATMHKQTPPDLLLLTTNDPTHHRPPLTHPSSLPSIHPQVRSTSRSTPKYTRSRSSS